MSKAKAKGTAAESKVAEYCRTHGHPYAERRALTGSADKGDIAGIPGAVIEVKDCVRLDLAGWSAEAETEAENADVEVWAVWFKRRGTTDPGKWYVLTSGEVFVGLIR